MKLEFPLQIYVNDNDRENFFKSSKINVNYQSAQDLLDWIEKNEI